VSTASTLTPETPETHVNPAHPTTSALSPALSADERRSLRRAVGLLNLDRSRFALAVVAGTAGMVSAVALSGVAAWLIARASQMPDVVALGVAPVAVRLFGISRIVNFAVFYGAGGKYFVRGNKIPHEFVYKPRTASD